MPASDKIELERECVVIEQFLSRLRAFNSHDLFHAPGQVVAFSLYCGEPEALRKVLRLGLAELAKLM